MIILGVNFSHDSALTIIKNGAIIASIEEEKTSRIKQDFGWPVTACKKLLGEHGITPEQVDLVAFGGQVYSLINKNEIKFRFDKKDFTKTKEIATRVSSYLGIASDSRNTENIHVFVEELAKQGFSKAKVKFYNHHLCHAVSAWYAAPFKCDLVFTSDGHGDGESMTFYIPSEGEGLKLQKSYHHQASVGQFYSGITELLGFKPNRHEGKITG